VIPSTHCHRLNLQHVTNKKNLQHVPASATCGFFIIRQATLKQPPRTMRNSALENTVLQPPT
jgi:hypothetical protein